MSTQALGPPPALVLRGKHFEFGAKTYLMGIVNVTPDSFSDGGRFYSPKSAIAHAIQLVEEGADILDVGGESTRPGAPRVDAEEEKRRVVPVIEGIFKVCPQVPISVDTTKSSVARAAIDAGATMVNDISGFTFDAKLPEVVAQGRVAACLMHIQGTPQNMQQAPRYEDVVAEVLAALSNSVQRAVDAGVPRELLVVDPGIGFGKTLHHNLVILRRLKDFRSLGLPVLLGTSRKSFIGQLLQGKPALERLYGTLGSVIYAASVGAADFLRVHDVAEVREALTVVEAIRQVNISAPGK